MAARVIGSRRVHSVSVTVEPEQYLAGWRSEAGCLFIPALSEARVGEQAAVRVGIFGQTIRATLFGRVSLVRRVGRPALPPGVELQLDRASLAAAGFLAMAARGEPVSFKERMPRFAVERRLSIEQGGTALAALAGKTTTGRSVDAMGALRYVRPPGNLAVSTNNAVIAQ